ncbi:L-aspartate oxidase [Microbacterium azadirachtae]|uniref:L-aspartate oxidase n=1 Tax=Microbacterium azadirachtae TaxID=582680 RepID=UPI0008841454|nr:L-aspartate oxidase [Microbacterium azadirachtae]SDM28251.1 L-aspartate oxidase [Microbacterium azadirachtae]SEG48712.1 L-aspartate oxidase [Microbacterium azadirachtae]SEG51258.1 L-aspartate oxidase [Microbacterium azadirachtae]
MGARGGRRVLVIGGGIAGLTTALHAHEAGHRVEVIVKDALGDGATALAQGGIAGAYAMGDSPAAHAEDTLVAGAGLSAPDAVDVLVRDATARIAELVARGVSFDRDADGTLRLGLEAAHSAARIAHAGGDATGAAISAALCARVREAGIPVREHALLVDLLVSAGAVRGARVLAEGRVEDLPSDAVVLATGGAGQLFAHTTAPAVCTGDGIAAALRAGAAVADLEFVQFHPTILVSPGPAFLISEAVRGEGATLIDDEGRRFVFDAHPDGELAPRDVVARAIVRRAAAQDGPVRLDATALCRREGWSAARLAARFPTIDRVTRERGFDWAQEPIPVTPAAHYLMGGVVTDTSGRTTLPGLFAVGECARTGVHGANRLASNSLLEGAVFGARAAAALGQPWPSGPDDTAGSVDPMVEPLPRSEAGPFSRAALQRLMWERVGPLRSHDGLLEALSTIRAWRAARTAAAPVDGRAPWTDTTQEIPPVPRPGAGSDAVSPASCTSRAAIEDVNLLEVADRMVVAALARPLSLGAHHVVASSSLALDEPSPALIGAR